MTKQRNALKAGLFIVISIALIIGVIVAIKGVGAFIEPQQVHSATFNLADDVGGLQVGDDVRIGGYKVGIVRSIHIETPENGQPVLHVTFNVPRRIHVRSGAHLAVQSTLTGTSWLNFTTLGSGDELASNATLQGYPSSYTVLTNTINKLAPELQGLARDVRTITLPKIDTAADSASQALATIRGNIQDIIDRYNKVADRLAEACVQIRDIIGDSKTDFRTTIANLRTATGSIKDKVPPILNDVQDIAAKVRTELDSTNGLLANVRDVASQLKGASTSANAILSTNRGKIDEIIRSLRTTSDNLKFATAEIRHSPWRLLYKPKPGEMGNLNLYDATRQFAEGANDLSNAVNALHDALADPHADKAKIEPLMQNLHDTFGKFQKVENDLWNRVKE